MRRPQDGAVAVEFALLLPVLVLLLVAILDYGLWYSDSISLRSTAREGARAAVVDNYPSSCSGNPARKTTCAAIGDVNLLGGTPVARAYVNSGTGDWTEGEEMVVCVAMKEGGLSGLVPLPSSGVLRTRVIMRIEASQSGNSTNQTGSDPSGQGWSWC